MTLLAVGLDLPTLDEALRVAEAVHRSADVFKVGLELLTGDTAAVLEAVASLGKPVFADVKFHDIPRTVEAASRTLARLPVDYFTAHTGGGREMLAAALDGAEVGARDAGRPRPAVLGVTVLTSLDGAALAETGVTATPAELVRKRVVLAESAGLDGIVCAAPDLAEIATAAPRLLRVAPGIRPAGHTAGTDDQVRTSTPEDAARAGAGMIVVARPVVAAADPTAAAASIKAALAR